MISFAISLALREVHVVNQRLISPAVNWASP
jgi:hypothetical protein